MVSAVSFLPTECNFKLHLISAHYRSLAAVFVSTFSSNNPKYLKA